MKVLIVDDEFEQRESVSKILKNKKYETIIVSDAVSALLALKDDKDIEIIITDYRMPGLSGKDWLELLKYYHPDKKVLVVTGYEVMKNNIADIAEVLIKPVKEVELLRAVGSLR